MTEDSSIIQWAIAILTATSHGGTGTLASADTFWDISQITRRCEEWCPIGSAESTFKLSERVSFNIYLTNVTNHLSCATRSSNLSWNIRAKALNGSWTPLCYRADVSKNSKPIEWAKALPSSGFTTARVSRSILLAITTPDNCFPGFYCLMPSYH